MPEVTISATSKGTRTAIVILTDLNAIEKKNPEITHSKRQVRFATLNTSRNEFNLSFSIQFLIPQAIEMLMTITETAAVIANA